MRDLRFFCIRRCARGNGIGIVTLDAAYYIYHTVVGPVWQPGLGEWVPSYIVAATLVTCTVIISISFKEATALVLYHSLHCAVSYLSSGGVGMVSSRRDLMGSAFHPEVTAGRCLA